MITRTGDKITLLTCRNAAGRRLATARRAQLPGESRLVGGLAEQDRAGVADQAGPAYVPIATARRMSLSGRDLRCPRSTMTDRGERWPHHRGPKFCATSAAAAKPAQDARRLHLGIRGAARHARPDLVI